MKPGTQSPFQKRVLGAGTIIPTSLLFSRWRIYNNGQNIWDKLYFSSEIAYYKEISNTVFQEAFASIDKIFFLRGGLGTRLQYCGVLKFSWYFLIG